MKCTIIRPDVTVRDLAAMLEDFVVLFVARENVLEGAVTNGDFRRGIARGLSLSDTAADLMNHSPAFVLASDGFETRLARARSLPAGFRYLPEVDDSKNIQRIVSDKALITIPNWAVIVAGGLGSRLRSLTEKTPKPMLRIGDRPVLQIIIEQLRRAGISRIFVSVNYRAEVIKEYFRDGSDYDVRIDYLEERERLGTAGCLSLLQEVPQHPCIVMNGDIVTDLDPHALLRDHAAQNAAATICTHKHRYEVPYGVVQTDSGYVRDIEEKPIAEFSVSAGIYALDPECFRILKPSGYLDMPVLLRELRNRGRAIGTFELPGPWIDIGNLDDFRRANSEYRDFVNGL